MAFAAVGAAELLSFEPGNSAALRLLTDYAATVARPETTSDWPWPEPRLTYANAILPEAMIAAGVALDDPDLKQRGLDLLEWLLDYETIDGHLSPTAVGGRGPQDSVPAFDQQPIEVATRRRLRTRRSRRSARPLAGRDPVGRRLVPGCQRLRVGHVGHRDWWWLRRIARRMRQPQPGRRIDPCGDLDPAARTALFAGPTMTLMRTGLVTRSSDRIAANSARVITRLFVPGQEGFELQESRAGVVLKRILALTDDDVRSSLDDVMTRFGGRHRDLVGTFRRHARELADRLDPVVHLSDARILLLGAAFTSEYAIEGAALCNPSIVAHPDQTDTAAGSLRFVMSVRGSGRTPLVHRVPHRCRRRRGQGHNRRADSLRHYRRRVGRAARGRGVPRRTRLPRRCR